MDAFGDSLARRLALFREGFFQRLSPDERQIVLASADATTEQMRHQRHVEAGEIAPDFNLTDQHGRLVRLSEQVTYGPVILLFVRGSWCPFSALALRSYQDALTAIHEQPSSDHARTAASLQHDSRAGFAGVSDAVGPGRRGH